MTKVYIVQLCEAECKSVKKVFAHEKDAMKYCKEMNKELETKFWSSLGTYKYIGVGVA